MPNMELDQFFDALYQKMKDDVLKYIIVKCSDTEDIQDIFQETFLDVVKILQKKGMKHFRKPEAVVMTIAKRKIYQHYNLKQKLWIDRTFCESLEDVEECLTIFEDFTIEDAIVKQEMIEEVQEILEKQDILTRKIFHLRFYMEESIEGIAEALDIPEQTVKNRLYRTMRRIKNELEEGADR